MSEFVTSSGEGERRAISVSGEVDIAYVDELLSHARACLEGPADICVIDLAGVTFMDSSGLGALVRIRNLAHDHDKQLVLSNVPARVSRLFEVSGLTGVFSLRSDG
jgi:anti-anti-sigma factor